MDHFDNCAAFEAGFGRALLAHERRAGHMKMLPRGTFAYYGGDVPTIQGLALGVLARIGESGTVSVKRFARTFPEIKTRDISTQVSSLITRGLVVREDLAHDMRVLSITDLGRKSLALSR